MLRTRRGRVCVTTTDRRKKKRSFVRKIQRNRSIDQSIRDTRKKECKILEMDGDEHRDRWNGVGKGLESDERGNYDSMYFESNKYLQSLCGACYGWRDVEGSGEQSCNERAGNSRSRIIYNSLVGRSFGRGSDVEVGFLPFRQFQKTDTPSRIKPAAFRTNLSAKRRASLS